MYKILSKIEITQQMVTKYLLCVSSCELNAITTLWDRGNSYFIDSHIKAYKNYAEARDQILFTLVVCTLVAGLVHGQRNWIKGRRHMEEMDSNLSF